MVILLVVASFAGSIQGKNGATEREAAARRAKARHFYLSAARYEAEEKLDMASELYQRAYEIDTTYPEAAFQSGIRRMALLPDTSSGSTGSNLGRMMVEKFRRNYPGDLFSNLMYARMLQRGGDTREYQEILESLRRHNPTNSDIVHMLSSAYMENKEYDRALEALDDYALAEGEDFELTVARASILFEKGDTLGALEAVERMERKEPRNTRYPLFKSQLYLYSNQPDSALATALRAERLTSDGEGGNVKLHLADIYLNMGDSINYDAKTYEALLSEDIDLETKNALFAYYLQNLISGNGDKARGDRLFAGLLAQYPHEASLRELSSRYNASKKDYAKAEEDIDYAIDLDHTNENYWTLAMMYAISADKPERVKKIYAGALENLDDISTDFLLLSGNAFLMNDAPAKSVEIYEECLKRNFPGQELTRSIDMTALAPYLRADNINGLIALYRQAGDAFYELKDSKHSFINYENALALDSDDALVLNNYAYFLVEGTDTITTEALKKADEMSAKAVALDPGNMIYLDTRAWILFQKREFGEALKVMEDVIKTSAEEELPIEGNKEYYAHYGDILWMNGKKDEAAEAWKKALKDSPDDEALKLKVKQGGMGISPKPVMQ